ncbi:hypothetical protein HOE67_00590 [Candidatus Peregrinibacteria bacterium]|jgi:hypothetical protein|nr:hypothetical protein [Candidatus Peregrinibacteria bacterium]MBT4055587.1 hypothetical protein [Candidatus Peregrinibacteria bacterium]
MKNPLLIAFMSLILFTGCTGPSNSEIATTGLVMAPSVVFLAFILIPPLSEISKNKKIIVNRHYLYQNLFLFILGVLLSVFFMYMYVGRGSAIGANYGSTQLFSIFIIPYIIFLTIAFLVSLPKSQIRYIPLYVILPYFLMFAGSLITNEEMLTYPIMAPGAWFISLPLAIIMIIYLRVKKT